MDARQAFMFYMVATTFLPLGYAFWSGAVVIETGDAIEVTVDPDELFPEDFQTVDGGETEDTDGDNTAGSDVTATGTDGEGSEETLGPTPRPTTTLEPTKSGASTTETKTPLNKVVAGFDREAIRDGVDQRVDDFRKNRDVSTLDRKSSLGQVAQSHATDMIERVYYSHTTPEGDGLAERMQSAGLNPDGCAETLFQIRFTAGEHDHESTIAEKAIKKWKNSERDREILTTVSHSDTGIGVGIEESGGEVRIVVGQVYC